jgi:uncharacterized protein YyaL (SSP411 family)
MSNRLAQETSPYLLQHADNPVDWHPWGEEALSLARAQDKPILLSVGYSACHWCHVMAYESFEDAEVAALLNAHYVNIKVDREERPDLDQIYQTAHHMLTQKSGGWPLTMFLMPDGTPFFGGTYFPKTARYGMPGFRDLLPKIAEAYHDKRVDIAKQNTALLEALERTLPASDGDHAEMSRAPLAAAVLELAQVFDKNHGGIGQAPKFPHPFELEFCLRRFALDATEHALTIAGLTLTHMGEGGIYDQLGGGFCRYSVDQHWTIPHFEKMLYDNGPLLALCSDVWRVTQQPLLRKVCAETAAWVMRDMQSPEGGYYASFDADAEHEEGKFYVWTRDEVKTLLQDEEYAVFALHYGLDSAPNFEGKYWNLRVTNPLTAVAQTLALSVGECESRLATARGKLLAVRNTRVWPGRDEKVLVSWNALMIKGMARAARVFDEPVWLASAQRAADFIRNTMWREDDVGTAGKGRLRMLATCKDGKAHLNAYLDDHAFLIDALIELMQTEFRMQDLEFARALGDCLLAQFEDPEHGGFYFTSHDHEKLIHRAKPAHDNATPAGNGIAAVTLQRLGHILGEPRYLTAAERAIHLFYPELKRHPSACVSLATALEEWLVPPRMVILRGPRTELGSWQRALEAQYRPDTLVIGIPADIDALPPALDKPAAANVNAWVCQGVSCLPAISNRDELERALGRAMRGQ